MYDAVGVRVDEVPVTPEKILRALNWSPQRPVGKARERNEKAIRAWQRTTWPALKKKPENRDARSSSSTKAD
ncbi:MAG: winged helix-turn-helix domain-containing protein [Bacteroidetes bacterium]|nr:winged helix-turn-helix domain-containing protein [Bacteroidota bacterium]